jgi:hypothetical protein
VTTKNVFKEAMSREMEKHGFRPLPLSRSAYALFHKKATGGLHLTVGVESSRLAKQAFTLSFYLAPAFSWSYAPPDGFPQKAYARIGEVLTPAERRKVDAKAAGKQVDVWWKGFTPENAKAAVAIADKAAKRFLETRGLADEVRKAPAMRELVEQLEAVRQAAHGSPRSTNRYLAKVKREQLVPEVWYRAAGALAARRFEDYNHKDGIKMLAEEAWLLETCGRARR